MLDNHPVLKERLMAFGAFAGIGIGAIAAVEVLVTGGFDIGVSRAPYDRDQPSAYVRVVQAAQSVGDRIRSISWDEPVASAAAADAEDLVGENDGAPPPDTLRTSANEDLYRQIETLYAENDAEAPPYHDAEAYDAEASFPEAHEFEAYEEQADEYPVTDDDDDYDMDSAKGESNASENASPW